MFNYKAPAALINDTINQKHNYNYHQTFPCAAGHIIIPPLSATFGGSVGSVET